MTELEILRAARASIATGEWDFGDWRSCTCGHIYRAAVPGLPASLRVVLGRGLLADAVAGTRDKPLPTAYARALEAVVQANPGVAEGARSWRAPRDGSRAIAHPVVMLVSDMTIMVARAAGTNDKRACALRLLDAAIAREEALDEEARLLLVPGDAADRAERELAPVA